MSEKLLKAVEKALRSPLTWPDTYRTLHVLLRECARKQQLGDGLTTLPTVSSVMDSAAKANPLEPVGPLPMTDAEAEAELRRLLGIRKQGKCSQAAAFDSHDENDQLSIIANKAYAHAYRSNRA